MAGVQLEQQAERWQLICDRCRLLGQYETEEQARVEACKHLWLFHQGKQRVYNALLRLGAGSAF